MIKKKMKDIKGVSLISLVITVTVLVILSNVVIYNLQDNLKIEKLKSMQNDIENLRDKVSSYYAQNGKIPTSMEYTNIEHIKETGVISDVADIGKFLVIDLSVLENLTLNYGKDFEIVKARTESANDYEDLYIINESSHNIFYVAGITIDNETFYTDYTVDDIDIKKIDLRYVDNVKIPEGYSYVEGNKEIGIVIKSNTDNKEYTWVVIDQRMTQLPDGITVNNVEEFLDSVNRLDGYYRSSDNTVVYIPIVEKWSPTYDKEGTYKDKRGDIAYIPEGFQVSEKPGENTIDEGLVIRNTTTDDRYVWIEVPKTIYTTAISSDDYENIEKDMITYASDYRQNGWVDTWYSKEQHGFETAQDYNDFKNNMLKSVYEKGGFWISQYEMGSEVQRLEGMDISNPAVSKEGAYPYNWVTCIQAQQLASNLNSGNYISSLMFGIQWDLVLKYIETKGAKTQEELKTDSTTWGNYNNAIFDVKRGKYSTDYETNFTAVTDTYPKLASNILLTTGAAERNSVLNVYDLAGNIVEWTLEYNTNTDSPCAYRGGNYRVNGVIAPASYRFNQNTTSASKSFGFRATLY